MNLPLLPHGRALTSLCMALLLTTSLPTRADIGDTFTVDCCTYTVQTEANGTGTVSLTGYKATTEIPETLRIDRVTAPSSGIQYTVTAIKTPIVGYGSPSPRYVYIGSHVTTFPDNPLAVVDGWTIRQLEIAEDNPKYEYYSHCLYDKTQPTAQEQFLGYITIASTSKDEVRLKEGITRISSQWNLSVAAGTLVCPSTLRSIDASAFASGYNYSLRGISLNEGLEEIGREAFKGCVFTTIDLPASLKTMGADAFANCKKLASVTLPASLVEKDYVYNTEYNKVGIGEEYFENCNAITQITIAEGTTRIGKWAFRAFNQLSANISLPNTLTSIGQESFLGSAITSIAIPNTVQTIGHQAFMYCRNLVNVTLPDNCLVSDGAFDDTPYFNNCKAASTDGATYIGATLFEFTNKTGVTAYAVKEGTKRIAWRAMKNTGCQNIKQLTLPSTLKEIGQYAFANMSALETLDIPNSVKSLSVDILRDCTSLKELHIGTGLESIDTWSYSRSMFGPTPKLTTLTVDPANPYYRSYNNRLIRRADDTLLEIAQGTIQGDVVIDNVRRVNVLAMYTLVGADVTVTFGPDVEYIDPQIGNYQHSAVHVKSYHVDSASPYYLATDGFLIRRADSTLIAAPVLHISEDGELSLPAAIARTSLLWDASYTKLTLHAIGHIDINEPTASFCWPDKLVLSYPCVSTITIAGKPLSEALSEIKGLISVDPYGGTYANGTFTAAATRPANMAANTLYFTPSSAEADQPNTVVVSSAGTPATAIATDMSKAPAAPQATCRQLTITDGVAFDTPIDFTAERASLSRTLPVGQWVPVGMPFSAQAPAGLSVQALQTDWLSDQAKAVGFDRTTCTLQAGQAYLVKATEATTTFAVTDATVPATIPTTEESAFVSVLQEPVVFDEAFRARPENQGYAFYAYDAEHTTFRLLGMGDTCPLYGGYLKVRGATATQLPVALDGTITGIDGLTADGDCPSRPGDRIYDLCGRRRSSLQRGLNIVHGRKVVVR